MQYRPRMPLTRPEPPFEKRQPTAMTDPHTILNAAADAIVSLDRQARIEYANRTAARLLAHDPMAELLGRPIRTYIPFMAPIDERLDCWDLGGIRLHAHGQETCWTDAGATLVVEYEACPLGDPRQPSGAVLTFREIGRRLAAERAKDEVIAVVSHELRSPLTAIRAAVGLVASGQVGQLEEPGRRMMHIAQANADRLLRLINELLDLQRLNSGTTPLTAVECDAYELMQQAADGLRLIAEQAKVTINVGPRKARLCGDSDRLVQVLTNLVANAIKFSPPGSTVWLQVEPLAGEAVFRVRDEGRGIPSSKLETIFEPFAQLEESDSRRKGGTGLGLAISRSIVAQHGGHIWAESSPGLGTTIFVALPLAEHEVEFDVKEEAA
jgi:signal transduction histidine kinase